MKSTGIDTFLNVTQAAAKSKTSAPLNGSGGEFDGYLRDAAHTQQQPAKEDAKAKVKPADTPLQSTRKEQDSASSSDEQTAQAGEVSEQSEAPAEEQLHEVEADEVLLSVAAATAADASLGIAQLTDLPVLTVVGTVDTAPVEPTSALSDKQATPTQELLPILGAETPAQIPTPGEAATNAAFEASASADATSAEGAVTTVPQQSEQQISQESAEVAEQIATATGTTATAVATKTVKPATKSTAKTSADSEKSDAIEQISVSPTAVDTRVAAEQLVAEVAAAVSDAGSSHDSTHKPTSEAASSTLGIQANPHANQQLQAAEAAQVDTPSLNDDLDSRMPAIDRTRFVQRVANAFRSAQQNDGHIQLRLSPPELGSLRIEIAVRNGVLSANLETETADARRVLLDNLPALRQRLAEQDIRIEKFDVDIRREGGQSDGQAGAQDRQTQQQSLRAAERNRIRTTATPEPIPAR